MTIIFLTILFYYYFISLL